MVSKKIKLKIAKYPKFYQKVWLATAKIPFGQTRPYEWVAKQVGSPKSARAVGQALKNNPFPITIPCHRVIRKDGTLGGFSQGIKKKIELLKKESSL